MLKLNAQVRDIKKSAGSIREEGAIPAVFYGQKVESTPISVDKKLFRSVWDEAGESSVITIHLGDKDIDALIHDVSVDPITSEPIHVDFYAIDKNKKVVVDVPLEFVGVSPAVKELGGTLVKVIHELEVEGLPKDLPQEITVDLSMLTTLDSHIAVKDLKLPEGVVAELSPEEVVASIAVQKEEVEETPTEIDFSEIEVEKKGKKEEEGEEGAPSEEAK